MSLEDAKSELKRYQDIKKEAEDKKAQATREQGEIERELSRQISSAVNSAIYGQDTNIDLLRSEISKTNANYQLLHRDMNNLNDILRDTTNLQAVYDVKHRELEAEYQDRRAELDKEYKKKLADHKDAINRADQEYGRLLSDRKKKKSELENEIRQEEYKLSERRESIKSKRKGILIALIICFIVAVIAGIILGVWLVSSGNIVIQPSVKPIG